MDSAGARYPGIPTGEDWRRLGGPSFSGHRATPCFERNCRPRFSGFFAPIASSRAVNARPRAEITKKARTRSPGLLFSH